MKPVTSQTARRRPGLWTCRAMSAETMKMPEPTIEPTTIMVASSRPKRLMRAGRVVWRNSVRIGYTPIAMVKLRDHEKMKALWPPYFEGPRSFWDKYHPEGGATLHCPVRQVG